MTLTLHILGLLSVLGAAVFGAAGVGPGARTRRWTWFVPAAGFVVVWPVASGVGPVAQTAAGAVAAAVAAVALLGRTPLQPVAFAGGAAAAFWGRYLEVLGLPVWLAVPMAAGVTATAIWLSVVRPYFAPLRIREEGLLLVLALGLAALFLPELVVGWRSASALNGGALQDPLAAGLPAVWALVVAGAAAVAGGFVAVRRAPDRVARQRRGRARAAIAGSGR